MVHVIGSKELPCRHHKITKIVEGKRIRCRTCGRKWNVSLAPAEQASKMTGLECVIVNYTEV